MPRLRLAAITRPLYLTIWQWRAHYPKKAGIPDYTCNEGRKPVNQPKGGFDYDTENRSFDFDETADRYDIRFDVNDYYGGLHCGDCMEVFVRGKWKPTRMEYGDNWYLVGIRAADLSGLRVRI